MMSCDDLFDLVIGAPAEQREAMLERECAGDSGLIKRVVAMVAAAEDDEQFLAEPTANLQNADATIAAAPREQPGQQIGRYKLLQTIGEGGFGTVWMADQKEPVKRRVALKIIKLGMDTDQVVARFEAERQALAIMDHPNIAKVFDAGATETGRPYFVMELVRGIADYRVLRPEKRLSIRERLKLIALVCEACNTRTRRASSTATSSRTMSWSAARVTGPFPRSSTSASPRPQPLV